MMRTWVVKESTLREIVEGYVSGFNDCACCPLYCNDEFDECEYEGIDITDCADRIMYEYL